MGEPQVQWWNEENKPDYWADHSVLYHPEQNRLLIGDPNRHHADLYNHVDEAESVKRGWLPAAVYDGKFETYSQHDHPGWDGVHGYFNKLHQAADGRDLERGQTAEWTFGKTADQGTGGDAYPGETAQAQVERQHVNDSYGQDSQFDDHPLAEYKFFFCNPVESPIWMADLSFKPIGEIQIGDEVVGWEGWGTKTGDSHARRSLCVSTVSDIYERQADVVRVTFESGRVIRCTDDHLWLRHWRQGVTRNSKGERYGERYSAPFVGLDLVRVVDPTPSLPDGLKQNAYWLGGIFDGEGHASAIQAVRLSQCIVHNPGVSARILSTLTELGLPFTFDGRKDLWLTGGRQNLVDFTNWTQPTKRSGIAARVLNTRWQNPDRIISVEPDGFETVFGLTTTTGNYVVWGYASKNCNGELDVSGAHDLDGLRERNNVPAEHSGPTAVGNLIVQDGTAIWEVASNVSLSALVKALKKYTKDGGWDWGGITDMKGEALGDPEKLARKRYYLSVTLNDEWTEPKVELHTRSTGAPNAERSVVDVVGRVAAWRGPGVAASVLKEFADDHNLKLAEYPGGGSMADQIRNHSPLGEDLELKNINAERPEEHELDRFHKDRDRSPEGIFNCPSCGRLFHRWHEYMTHRREEEPPGEPVQDGKFPTVEESMSEMPSFTEARVAKQWMPHEEETEDFMLGQCAAWATAHHETHPHLKFGIDWEHMTPDHPSYDWEQAYEDGHEHHDPNAPEQWRVQHVFTHDDTYAYDVEGAHPLPHKQWDDVTLGHSREDVESTGMLECGYMPDQQWMRDKGVKPRVGASDWKVTESDFDPANTAFDDGDPDRSDQRVTITHLPSRQIFVGQPGTHHADLIGAHGLEPDDSGPYEWTSDQAHYHDDLHYGWIKDRGYGHIGPRVEGVTEKLHVHGLLDQPDGSKVHNMDEKSGWSFDSHIDHSTPPEIASNFLHGARRLAIKQPKDLFSDPVPFIYDIELDRIFVGHPGARHGEIEAPAGTKFTPGGIVEGEYQPGGKVVVESQSDTPYSVRHMVGLWYYQHPEFEVTGILMTMPDGKQRKIAGTQEYYHTTSVDLNPGDALIPGGPSGDGKGWQGFVEGYNSDKVYLWTTNDDPIFTARSSWDQYGKHVYEVEPTGLVTPDPAAGDDIPGHLTWVADGARVLRRVTDERGRISSQNIGAYVIGQAAQDPAVHAAWLALQGVGGEVYGVGGVVRDALLGKASKDVDLLVTGLPAERVDKTLRKLPGRVDLTGKDFGVFRYNHDGNEVEIALPRTEKSTGERRVDFDVAVDHNLPIETDLQRRDFTANAIAVSLRTGEMIDPYGGADDIANKRLRTVHDNSFPEDPTRLVRGLVAHSRHDLHPDPKTLRQMQAHAPDLAKESAERIQAELDKLFSSDNPGAAIRLAHKTGMLKYLLPEVEAAWDFDQNNKHHNYPLGEHLINVLDHISKTTKDPDLRLAALLHDIGKPGSAWEDPDTGQSHYYKGPNGEGANHEELGSELAGGRLRELRHPTKRTERIEHLVKHHMYPDFSSPKGARKFLNRVGPEHAHDLMLLREADRAGKGTDDYQETKTPVGVQRQLVDEALEAKVPTDRAGLAVNGNDLMGLGLQPGPAFSQILQSLTELVLEHPELNEKHSLINYVRHELMPSDNS